jgi:probable phosphoglycerate mutase
LNECGREHARQVAEAVPSASFACVFTSPLRRADQTCALAGFADGAAINLDLLEWDYGRYEGKMTGDILKERPGWELFRDGCPDGESAKDVADRADRFIRQVHDIGGDVLAFSSGHIIRMIAARWLGFPPEASRCFFCRPASVGELEFQHESRDQPSVRLWNYVREPRK